MRALPSLALAVIVGLGLLTACASTPTPAESDAQPVTAAEAELLAAARFRNFDAGTRAVSFDVEEDGRALHLAGWFDYATHTGYGALTADGAPNALTLWNATAIAVHAPLSTGAGAAAPLPIPDAAPLDDAWRSAPLAGARSRLHSMLQVIASLGTDRPDNPLLLRQGGALTLGHDSIEGTDVTVFAGPVSDSALPAGQSADPEASTTRFWLDAEGVMRQAAVRLGGSGPWHEIAFADASGVDLGDPFARAAAG